jgi:hypothetical protein
MWNCTVQYRTECLPNSNVAISKRLSGLEAYSQNPVSCNIESINLNIKIKTAADNVYCQKWNARIRWTISNVLIAILPLACWINASLFTGHAVGTVAASWELS